MQGKILDYNNELKSGLIRGENGNKYRFSIDDCKSVIKPRAGAEVDFESSGDKAVEIYVITKDTVDDIKNIATSATHATVEIVKTSASMSKKIIPYIISILVLIGLAVLIYTVYENKQRQQAEERIAKEATSFANKIKATSIQADSFFVNKQYQDALSLYESLYQQLSQYNESYDSLLSSLINTHTYPYSGQETVTFFQFRMVACLIELKNPIRAEGILSKINISDTYVDSNGEEINQNIDEKDKAKYYILKAKINALNKKYRPVGGQYSFMDTDNYSSNAEQACRYGDCSLVKNKQQK